MFIGWSWRGQRYELRDGKTWCNGCLLGFNAAKDKSVSSRNEDGQAWHIVKWSVLRCLFCALAALTNPLKGCLGLC